MKRGVWRAAEREREVAVKMLLPGPTSQDTVRFLQEAAIMGQFRHPNIVQLLGVVTVGEPVSVVYYSLHRSTLTVCVCHSADDCPGATQQ